ncbi:unnamed protein product [Caenorhabditis nigoni]
MRIQLFWIFGLLYLGYCGRPAEYLKVFSNFDLLFRELSAIARIVNAISLQASVIRKTFHPYEILGESLKANPSAFNEILTTDVSGYNASVDFLFESLAEIQKRTEKYVLELRNASQMTEKIMEGMNIKLKKNDPVLREYFETLTSNSTIKILLTCEKNLVAEILKFWNTLSNQPSGLTTKTQQKDSIILIKSKIPEISKCLESLSKFPEFLDPILKKGEHLEKILEASANLKFLEGKHSTVSGYSTNLNTTVTQMLQEVLKLWNPPEIQAFKLMEDSVNLWKRLKEPEKIPELNQTVGFGRWFSRKDLNSKFFKDKISKHKSTENLEKALDGFADFGILVIRLRVEFIGFDEDFDEFLDEMRDFKNNLKVLETFENPKNAPDDLKTACEIFDKCWTSKTSAHSKKLQNFEKNIKKFVSFNSTISKIRFWVNKTVSTIDLEVVRNGFEEIGNLEISEKSLEEMKEAILGISNFETMEKFLERFSRLSELQKELETGFEEIRNLNLTKMTTEAVENLQDKDILEFREVFELAKNITGFKGQEKTFSHISKQLWEYDSDDLDFDQALNSSEHLLELKLDFSNFEGELQAAKLSFLEIKDYFDEIFGLKSEEKDGKISLAIRQRLFNPCRRSPTFADVAEACRRLATFVEGSPRSPAFADTRRSMPTFTDACRRLPTLAKTRQRSPTLADTRRRMPTFPDAFRRSPTLVQDSPAFADARRHSPTHADVSRRFPTFTDACLKLAEAFRHSPALSDVHRRLFKACRRSPTLADTCSPALADACRRLPTLVQPSPAFADTRRHSPTLALTMLVKRLPTFQLFMDRQDGQNALIDAVREINASHVREIVRGGAYINVYSQHGNTCLHMATKRGYAEIVEILIKNGADRNLLNSQNKTPEQMLNTSYRTTQTDTKKVENYEKIEKIYKKSKNKKYRIRVPDTFPSSSFHIFADKNTDDELTNRFMGQFSAIASTELLPTTTHYIVHTDSNGILEIDSFELVVWILSGVIIVRDTWMMDCLKDKNMIEKDSAYLVERVRYKGMVYDTVIQWSNAMAKGTMPYLYGVYVAVVIQNYGNLIPLVTLVTTHGGIILELFPEKSQFNIGSHPYLHAHLGPLFIIHDGQTNLESYKNDTDKMYTLFTEEEFVHFMLKRMINVDKSENPISVLVDGED